MVASTPCLLTVQLVRMAKKTLLPHCSQIPPQHPQGLLAKGPPCCPYLQAFLLSMLHSCGKRRVPARCSLSALGCRWGAEPAVGSTLHPPASGTEPVAGAVVPGKAGGTVVSPLLNTCPGRRTPGRAKAPPRAGSASRHHDRDPFFYPFIIFFYRLRAEYENHQPKHLKKRSRMFFFFFLFCFPPKSVCAFA